MIWPVPRIVLNFAARCTLKCEWCYIDFGRHAPTLEESTAIIRRCRELGSTWITIAGGDPSAMPFLPELLRNAKACGFLVHLDTNAIGLAKHLAVVASMLDLLGLPLDGSARVHDEVRAHDGHFQIVMNTLHLIRETQIPLKFNTMLCKSNASHLEDIASIVREFEPMFWSIYRYWPLAAGAAVAPRFELNEAMYREATAIIASKVTAQTRVEIADGAARTGRTLLVTHDGVLHAHCDPGSTQYTYFGSIFNDAVVEKAVASVVGDPEQVLERYTRTTKHLRVT